MRTLITGMGIWSCIGTSLYEVTESLRTGRSGIDIDPQRKAYGYQSPLTGIVPHPDMKSEGLRRAQRVCMGEPAEYAYMAVKQALQQSGITDLHRCALIVSNDSTAHAMADTEAVMALHHDSRHLGAGKVFQSLNSTVSMNLASVFGIGGLSLTVSAACAGGGHAIGIAHALIQSGMIDCCIVVGAQEVGLHAYTSFDALGVFSRHTDDPATASRPFDASRDGLVPSGGAACVILESEGHAAMGNRRPLATIAGYGFATSRNIVTPTAEAYFRSMTEALSDAGSVCGYAIATNKATVTPALIMAHATATRDGDTAEAEAIASLRLFDAPTEKTTVPGASPFGPYVLSTKALTGHECWMSGVSQVVYAVLQMQGRFVAPNVNLRTPDPAARLLNLPTTIIEDVDLPVVLCNAFGFGGTCASLVLTS